MDQRERKLEGTRALDVSPARKLKPDVVPQGTKALDVEPAREQPQPVRNDDGASGL